MKIHLVYRWLKTNPHLQHNPSSSPRQYNCKCTYVIPQSRTGNLSPHPFPDTPESLYPPLRTFHKHAPLPNSPRPPIIISPRYLACPWQKYTQHARIGTRARGGGNRWSRSAARCARTHSHALYCSPLLPPKMMRELAR